MRISCPTCQATYSVDQLDKDALMVCHRCGTEFGYGGEYHGADKHARTDEAAETDSGMMFLFSESQETGLPATEAEPAGEADEEALPREAGLHETSGDAISETEEASLEETALPQADTGALQELQRKAVNIWPWLVAILLLIAVTGLWMNRDLWLDNPWIRSVMINAGLPVDVRDKDWRVMPESVRAQWIKRDDKSHVLVIDARVKNLLQCELPPPRIRVLVYGSDDPDRIVMERTMPITEPPLIDAIRHAPFVTPPENNLPVTARSDRGFILVLENLPKNAGDFSLLAVAEEE